MNISLNNVVSQNVTIIYDALDVRTIDLNALRELMGAPSPVIMDTPDMIVAAAPTRAFFVQIGDRRIRVTYQRQTTGLNDKDLCELALGASTLARSPRSTLIAYGFNYDVAAVADNGDARQLVLDTLVPRREAIEAALEGELVSAIPRFVFSTREARCDMIIEPAEAGQLKVHLNAHFEGTRTSLPPADELRATFVRQYESLGRTLSRLFAGQASI